MAQVLLAPVLETGIGTSGKFVLVRKSDGAFWSTVGVAFETYNASNIANYGIAATEIGASGNYKVTNPSEGTPCSYQFIKSAGSSLIVSDLINGLRWQDDAGPGAVAALADGSITESTFTTPSEASGRPAGILGMIRRTFERYANKRTRDRATGIVNIRNAADSGNLETQTQSTSGDVDTQSAGV